MTSPLVSADDKSEEEGDLARDGGDGSTILSGDIPTLLWLGFEFLPRIRTRDELGGLSEGEDSMRGGSMLVFYSLVLSCVGWRAKPRYQSRLMCVT